MTKQIQLFKPIFDKESILFEIGQCLDQGWTGLGFKTIEFEERFKDHTGLPNAHFVNSATSALHLALEIIKLKSGLWEGSYSGDFSVVTTPLTFISDSHVIRHAGLSPLFCDIDESLCMNPEKLEIILKARGPRIAAVIYVGMGGNTGRLNYIQALCNQYNIPLILDASHMMGTYYNKNHVGREANYAIFSFQAVKNLPTADSGMIVCKEEHDDILARRLSWLGINKDTWERQNKGGNWDYRVDFIGWKYHGNSIMAAMALVGLRNLRWQNAVRREQASLYTIRLEERYERIPMNPDCMSSRHLFQVRVKAYNRDEIIAKAGLKGVQLGVHYKSHHEYPMYADSLYFCPEAIKASDELISLPIGPHLSEKDVNTVIEVLDEIKF